VGHGLSEGERMHVSDFSNYCNDVVQHVAVIKNKHPSIPLFIIGHSMVSSYRLHYHHHHHHHAHLLISFVNSNCIKAELYINALERRGSYSAKSNDMKLVYIHWPLMGGLLHLVQHGWN